MRLHSKVIGSEGHCHGFMDPMSFCCNANNYVDVLVLLIFLSIWDSFALYILRIVVSFIQNISNIADMYASES